MLCSCHDCVITNSHAKKQQLSQNNDHIEEGAETIEKLQDWEKFFNNFDSVYNLIKSSKDFSAEQKDLLTQSIKVFAYKDASKTRDVLAAIGDNLLWFSEHEKYKPHMEYLIELMDNTINNAESKKQIFTESKSKNINRILQAMPYSNKIRHSIIRNLASSKYELEIFENILNSNIVSNFKTINDVDKSARQGLEASFLILKSLEKYPVLISYPQYTNSILNASLYHKDLAKRVIELFSRGYLDKTELYDSIKNSYLLNNYQNLNLNEEQIEYINNIKDILNNHN